MARRMGSLSKSTLEVLSTAGRPVTWKWVARELGERRVINPHARSEAELVRTSLRMLAAAHQVARVGTHREPGINRPMTTFAPVARSTPDHRGNGGQALQQMLQMAWR